MSAARGLKKASAKAAPKPKPVPAVARTLSLFTGMTDFDSPNARDGSLPAEHLRRKRATKTASDWKHAGASAGVAQWAHAPSGHFVEGRDGRFFVSRYGKPLADFETLTEATVWAERQHREGVKR